MIISVFVTVLLRLLVSKRMLWHKTESPPKAELGATLLVENGKGEIKGLQVEMTFHWVYKHLINVANQWAHKNIRIASI